jgi:hypothetical protein
VGVGRGRESQAGLSDDGDEVFRSARRLGHLGERARPKLAAMREGDWLLKVLVISVIVSV